MSLNIILLVLYLNGSDVMAATRQMPNMAACWKEVEHLEQTEPIKNLYARRTCVALPPHPGPTT